MKGALLLSPLTDRYVTRRFCFASGMPSCGNGPLGLRCWVQCEKRACPSVTCS